MRLPRATLVGVLSKNYPDVSPPRWPTCRLYARFIDNALSIGLGQAIRQSTMVAELARQLQPQQHVNQVFTGVGASRALLGQSDTLVNGLVSPPAPRGW